MSIDTENTTATFRIGDRGVSMPLSEFHERVDTMVGKTFRVVPTDRAYLKAACELAKKAGKAAASACATAECTQGEHEGMTLEGYAEENILRIDKIVGTELEIPRLARLALLTGLRIYAAKLQKLKESEGDLLAPIEGTEDTEARIRKLLMRFNTETPEFALGDDEDDAS